METLDLITKIGNLGGLALFAYVVLGELKEQRREWRRARSNDNAKLDELTRLLTILVERTGGDPEAVTPMPMPRAITGPVQQRSRPHHYAPAHGVPRIGDEVTQNERPSKRMRTVSDSPDEDDE